MQLMYTTYFLYHASIVIKIKKQTQIFIQNIGKKSIYMCTRTHKFIPAGMIELSSVKIILVFNVIYYSHSIILAALSLLNLLLASIIYRSNQYKNYVLYVHVSKLHIIHFTTKGISPNYIFSSTLTGLTRNLMSYLKCLKNSFTF